MTVTAPAVTCGRKWGSGGPSQTCLRDPGHDGDHRDRACREWPRRRSVPCPGRARHWRVAFGTVGLRTPVCVFCGSPNPRPLSEHEWRELAAWAAGRSVGDHVRTALETRNAIRQAGETP